jgi:hypothetical protein
VYQPACFDAVDYRNGDDGHHKVDALLVDQHSTLRRHMASKHKVRGVFVTQSARLKALRVSTGIGASLPTSCL